MSVPLENHMPHLARIRIYPVKGLDPLEVQYDTLTARGSLTLDREYAFVDGDGKFINGKRVEAIHGVRSDFERKTNALILWKHGTEKQYSFQLPERTVAAEQWMSEYLGYPVRLQQNTELGFPDDSEASGPTVVSTETIETIASWFPGVSVESIRRRFRANLEIGNVEPFWEDRLFSEKGKVVTFKIGAVTIHGTNPCQRCIVPTRDPDLGTRYPDFQKIFQEKRKAALPAWANPARFDNYYRLTTNTRINPDQAEKTLMVGDAVHLDIL